MLIGPHRAPLLDEMLQSHLISLAFGPLRRQRSGKVFSSCGGGCRDCDWLHGQGHHVSIRDREPFDGREDLSLHEIQLNYSYNAMKELPAHASTNAN
jgi:hypothetical protein